MKPHLHFSLRLPLLVLFAATLLIAACGGGNSTSDDSGATTNSDSGAAPVATMPVGNFTSVGEASGLLTRTETLSATQPLSESVVSTDTATTADAPAADPTAIARGLASYEKNKCADCHGAAGEGVEGKGKAIAGTALTLEEFDQLLRTGGGLGNSHIFGRSAISPSGMNALHAYVQSLQ